MIARHYCGYVGAAFEYERGQKCPECGHPSHREVDTCFRFVDCDGACGDSERHDGHPCALPPHHEGPHDYRGEP